jgi:hypothetical protein
MYRFVLFLTLLALVLSATSQTYAGSSLKNIVAVRTNSNQTIDGILNEDSWKHAVPVTDFVQYDPSEGGLPTEKTSVSVLYDDRALYVGVMCYDSKPKGIKKQLTRRDRSSEADRFSVTIDSYNDGQTGFVFAGTVSGVQSDGVFYYDGVFYDIQWDAVWNYAAKVVRDGWSAEFKIPYSALRFTKQNGEYVWGINFRRYVAGKKEIDEWVMIPRSETGVISKIGNVSGIVGINLPLHLTLSPYVVGKGNFENNQKPFTRNNVLGGDAGVDVKYGVTSNFTLDVAANPDFGQVEVDKEVMNLTVFETEYPEKRPFFLEGSHFFSFGLTGDEKQLNLFYSRRIGRYPRYSDYLPTDVKFIENPKVTSILGAVKLSGRTERGLTIGALSAFTDAEKATYKTPDGTQISEIVEPKANYNVLRLKQDVFSNSSVGILATSAFIDKYSPNLTSGFDWNLRFFNNSYAIDGFVAGSQAAVGSEKFYGTTGKLFVGKVAGDHWLYNTSYDYASKRFCIDELGLFNQPREQGGITQLLYKEDQAPSPFLRYQILFQSNYRWDFENVNTVKFFGLGPTFLFKNFWSLTLQLLHDRPAYDEVARGIVIGKYRRPSTTGLTTAVSSDTRLPISFNATLGYEADTKLKKLFISSLDLTIRPTSYIELVPMLSFSRRWKEEAGIVLGNSYLMAVDTISQEEFTIFGNRDLQYFDLSLKGILTLTNKLSFQFFSQVLFYKWHYEDLKLLNRSDQFIPFDESVHQFYPYPSYSAYKNLNRKTFNANIVLRWEYLPGSTLFFVWTQNRQIYDFDYSTFFTKNMVNTFKIPADNVVLLKITYWFSF